MSSNHSIGAMNQLADALDKAGYTPDDITRLRQGDLAGILGVLNGRAKIVPVELVAEERLKSSTFRIRFINETTIMVNLDAPPKLPFNDAKIEFQVGAGWAKVEKCPDGLYVNDRKVVLYFSERQKGKKPLPGYELRKELAGKPVLHPNIMDALFENQHFIPEDWKIYENYNARFIFFWGVIFRHTNDLFVRSFCSDFGGEWYRIYYCLEEDMSSFGPAALLAS